jgi:hypothetical protein
MEVSVKKRRPWIAEQSGSLITRDPDEDGRPEVQLSIGGQLFRAPDNTRLLIKLFRAFGEQ